MKLKIFFSTIFFILLALRTIAQTRYYKTFKVSGSDNKSITFEVTPQNVNISSIYDNTIRYDINYKIKITTSNMPQQLEIRNVFIQFQGSQNASEGQSWPDFDKTQLPASGLYEGLYKTSNNPIMTGTYFSQLKDQNKSNNTGILPIANYNAVNLQFTIADKTPGQYKVFTFDNYNTTTGEKLIPFSIVLPVTLSNFNAKQENKSVFLNWKTSSEINNNYFVLERSIDSKKFDSIAQIKGAGNSSIDNNYTFKDYNYTSSTNYYRLKQMDFDGVSNWTLQKTTF